MDMMISSIHKGGHYQSQFGEMQGEWYSGESRINFRTGLWKEIRKEWEVILKNAQFVIGDGSRVSFWKDLWCGEVALCMVYPTWFSLADQGGLGHLE